MNKKHTSINSTERRAISIENIIIRKIEIPFNIKFKHAQASRSQAYGILVQISDGDHIKGYGESCPRTYVTGEDYNTAQGFYKNNLQHILNRIIDYPSLLIWVHDNQALIDQNPAAWCALELALLDFFAKIESVSVESLMAIPNIENRIFQYSAILGSGSLDSFKQQLKMYISIGFTDFKFKLSGIIQDDKARLSIFQSLAQPHFHLRWDANNLWKLTKEVTSYFNILLSHPHNQSIQYTAFSLEEPLKVNQYSDLIKLANSLNMPIILDESFTRYEQFNQLEGTPDNWIINVRISKMGGLIRSKAIIEMAKEKGISVILGAQVGETSLLTRAALAMVSVSCDSLRAQEGAFGDLLLKNDVTKNSLKFGSKGQLQATFQEYGFGLTMNNVVMSQLNLLE